MLCSLQDYPSIAQLHEKLQESNVLPIFAVTKQFTSLYKVTTFEWLQQVARIVSRAPLAQLVELRAVTREVVSSTPAGPTLRVLK